MMRCIPGFVLVVGLFAAVHHVALQAESRGAPWTEEQLLNGSLEVFVGEVLDTTTFDSYQRTVPTRVRALLSVKGKVRQGDRILLPKDPGKSVYFDEEFSQPEKGRLGVFYVGNKEQPNLLIGYRQISE